MKENVCVHVKILFPNKILCLMTMMKLRLDLSSGMDDKQHQHSQFCDKTNPNVHSLTSNEKEGMGDSKIELNVMSMKNTKTKGFPNNHDKNM